MATKIDALVVGGDGLIGMHVARALSNAGSSYCVTSRRSRADALSLDLAAPSFDRLDDKRFSFAVVCAAVPSMQACEIEPERTHRINVEGTVAVLRHLAERGTVSVFLSSSQVFDGETPAPDETAPYSPKNAYGRQKREVEEIVARERLPVAVLRVPKVLARQAVGMFAVWHASLCRGEPIVAAANMPLAPVSAEDVATAAICLASRQRTGVWHLSSSDEVSYHQAALWLADSCGISRTLVDEEIVTEEKVPAIYRHRYAALATNKIASEIGMPIRATEALLKDLFADFPKRRSGA